MFKADVTTWDEELEEGEIDVAAVVKPDGAMEEEEDEDDVEEEQEGEAFIEAVTVLFNDEDDVLVTLVLGGVNDVVEVEDETGDEATAVLLLLILLTVTLFDCKLQFEWVEVEEELPDAEQGKLSRLYFARRFLNQNWIFLGSNFGNFCR